jgi:hypothetical protein
MAIQEAFASSPRLPGENGGGGVGVGAANNGHASLLSGSVSETGVGAPPPPPLPPAVCSSCSASCSSTSSPAAAAGVQPGILGCSARKEFRRSLVNCGEMGKSLIDIGELSAKTVDAGSNAAGVKAFPAVTTAAGASPTGISATAAALLSFCPAGIYQPARECAACKEDAAAAAASRESQTGSSAATTPEQSAAAAGGSISQEISPGQTGSEATDSGCPPAAPVGNGSVAGVGAPVRARAVTRTTVPTPLRVERKDNATPPSRPAAGGRQAVPRHRFIINLDDKNKFTDEVTV